MGRKAKELRSRTERKIREHRLSEAEQTFLSANARYEGSPYHKRNPGDFGLNPPALPRRDATLCDEAGVVSKERAQQLLRLAIERGLVSERAAAKGYPKQLWAYDGRHVFEAMYGGSQTGCYHGYPIRQSDPLFAEIVQRWSAS